MSVLSGVYVYLPFSPADSSSYSFPSSGCPHSVPVSQPRSPSFEWGTLQDTFFSHCDSTIGADFSLSLGLLTQCYFFSQWTFLKLIPF